LFGSAAKIGLDRIGHRQQAVASAVCDVMGDDDLCFGVDGDLAIIGLYEAVLVLYDPALGLSEILLGLDVWRDRGRRGRPTAFAPSLCLFALQLPQPAL
jgi:hypothetical protein